MLGYVYTRGATFIPRENQSEGRAAILRAAEEYTKCANSYPEDDEYVARALYYSVLHDSTPASKSESRIANLALALCYLSMGGATTAQELELMKRIRLSYEQTQQIWKNSSAEMQGGNEKVLNAIKLEAKLRRQIESGELKPTDTVAIHHL